VFRAIIAQNIMDYWFRKLIPGHKILNCVPTKTIQLPYYFLVFCSYFKARFVVKIKRRKGSPCFGVVLISGGALAKFTKNQT
jgi:hypothetical protein